MQTGIWKFLMNAISSTPLRNYVTYRYNFYFTVPQLMFLCQCVEQVRDDEGAIAEVGCANGLTTVFINKYMDDRKIEKKYYAIDTFSGFVSEDIDYEVLKRHKNPKLFEAAFEVNKKRWFDYTMKSNNIHRVTSIQADVNKFNLKTLGALSFVLLDVDLYRPMKKSLRELYEVLTPNGIMVVDDCDIRNLQWDGSDQAYKEFMKEIGQPDQVVYDKLGIVRKESTSLSKQKGSKQF